MVRNRHLEKVTYKMIKEYIKVKYGFKVHTSYIAEVKRDLGLPLYDAPNAVEKLKNPINHPTPVQVNAIKDAILYYYNPNVLRLSCLFFRKNKRLFAFSGLYSHICCIVLPPI